jgi:3-hydroxymyristoyl/3-hydroxydecanoyl-(acyl carrier protein) dehydratase
MRTNHQDQGISLDLRIPESLAYFQGHFDEVSVVPGVVQIQWAVQYARQYLEMPPIFSHLDAIKFKELVLPGQVLTLALSYRDSDHRLAFSYRRDTTEYSSGRIYFHGRTL